MTQNTLNDVFFLCLQSSQKLDRKKTVSKYVILCHLVLLKPVIQNLQVLEQMSAEPSFETSEMQAG